MFIIFGFFLNLSIFLLFDYSLFPKGSSGDPSGAATSKVELNYSAQEAARDLRFENIAALRIQDNII